MRGRAPHTERAHRGVCVHTRAPDRGAGRPRARARPRRARGARPARNPAKPGARAARPQPASAKAERSDRSAATPHFWRKVYTHISLITMWRPGAVTYIYKTFWKSSIFKKFCITNEPDFEKKSAIFLLGYKLRLYLSLSLTIYRAWWALYRF